ARRRAPAPPGREPLLDLRLHVAGRGRLHARPHAVAGQAARNEHHLALVAGEAEPAIDALLDDGLDDVAGAEAARFASRHRWKRLRRGRPCASSTRRATDSART